MNGVSVSPKPLITQSIRFNPLPLLTYDSDTFDACRNLPVAYLINTNFDTLQYSPVMAKLTGTGIQVCQ